MRYSAQTGAAVAPEPSIYSVCFFGRNFVVPDVLLIEAGNDDEALIEARRRRLFTTREVWSGHRLVGVIPPTRTS